MVNDILYELRDVRYAYLGRFTALDGVSLAIRKGERVALLGANGSGKSTLLMVLAGLIFPADGAVKFCGRGMAEGSFADASFRKDFRSRVGIVFQNSDVQLFNSSVEDEIVFGLLQLGLPARQIKERTEKYLELMVAAHLKDRAPHYMSTGEKKKVAIASVLAMEPEVILLDEPTAGLDPRTSRQLVDTMVKLGEEGKTVITSTQDIHLVSEIADRAIVLSEAKKIARDSDIHSVLSDHSFLQEHNLIHMHAHKHDGKVHVHEHEHPDHHHSH